MIDLAQQGQIAQLREELEFKIGQNEAFLGIISILVEKLGGEVFLPTNFQEQLKGSRIQFIPQLDGIKLLQDREIPEEELSQLSE